MVADMSKTCEEHDFVNSSVLVEHEARLSFNLEFLRVLSLVEKFLSDENAV